MTHHNSLQDVPNPLRDLALTYEEYERSTGGGGAVSDWNVGGAASAPPPPSTATGPEAEEPVPTGEERIVPARERQLLAASLIDEDVRSRTVQHQIHLDSARSASFVSLLLAPGN